MRNIPFFNYQYFYNVHGKTLLRITEDVLKRGAFILQKDMFEFEENFAKYLGVKHAISVANCSDALTLILENIGLQPNDEVIFPSHTFVATAASIVKAGAKPIPVECGSDHMMDPTQIEKAITSKTRAILPVQLNGRTCDMDAISAIANEYNLIIVEDAAQAFGSQFKQKKAGTFGLASAFSFYPAKTLGCLGDGGMVATHDDALADVIFSKRDHGRNKEGEMIGWGQNSRLDNMQAAYLNYFLSQYDETIAYRRHLAKAYNDRLCTLSSIKLPPYSDTPSNHFDVYQNYEIEAENRDALRDHLKQNGIGTLLQWGGTVVHQFKALGFNTSLPFTEQMIQKSMLLPMNLSVTEEDVDYICQTIVNFYNKYTERE